MLGKWHLGQREAYLPASRASTATSASRSATTWAPRLSDCGNGTTIPATVTGDWSRAAYAAHGYTQALRFEDEASDRGGRFLPLVSQSKGATTVVEQPVDLTHLQEKYAAFATDFIGSAKKKFFFYAALSHAHDAGQSARQAAESAGSVGHLYARSAGYWNVGKGSTWEGGIREPAFVSWKGVAEELPVRARCVLGDLRRGELTPANGGVAPDADAEVVNGTALYGVCCDRQAADTCDCDGKPYPGR
ncbi:sulfuric ester hydrolase [Aureococcus anophagefferens]|nr:sulfuric ester hydrolase [Aureococcus anophagefferens]